MKLLIFALFSSICFASQKPTLAVPVHPGYSLPEHPGFWNEFEEELKKVGLYSFDVKYHPFRRVIQGYSTKKYDCMVGGDKSLIEFYGSTTKDKIFSKPHLAMTSRLFTREEKICDPKELEGKSIIVIDTFPYKKVLEGIKLKRVENAAAPEHGIKMLLAKRADALISFYPTPENDIRKLSYCPKLFFTKTYETIHCYKSKATQKAMADYNKALKKLKESGVFQKLLNKHFGSYGKIILEQIEAQN